MPESPGTVDWAYETRRLKELEPMASRVHVVTAETLLRRFEGLSSSPDETQVAKILAVKLVAEAMSALEDFGALCRAVRERENGGIIRNYLNYEPGEISTVYQEIRKENSAWNYLRLYVPAELADVNAEDPNLVWDLAPILDAAAEWQQVPGMVNVFNGTKHGFRVLGGVPEGGYTDTIDDVDSIYILTRDPGPGLIRLKKFREWPERANMVIERCAEGWRQLANLICFMHERGHSLQLTPAPSPSPPGSA